MISWIIASIQIVAILGMVSSSLYFLLCLRSATQFLRQRSEESKTLHPDATTDAVRPISILKPLKGVDPEMHASLRSHCLQDHPHYEIVFGVSEADDPAVEVVQKLQQEFPNLRIALVVCSKRLGPNRKVSNLAQMLTMARYDDLIVNDSDIRVEPDYLRRVAFSLGDPQTGLVTCLYRGVAASTLGSRLEALGIATDFCPSVLAARQLEGGIRFGLGSTLAFRRSVLQNIGGFETLVDYLADDYELGKRLAQSGLNVELSNVVVETWLPAYGVRAFLRHQLRWARGVRDARAGGYLGLVFTFGLFWALLAVVASGAALWACLALAVTLLLRLSVALLTGRYVLYDRAILKILWLIPLRDLVAAAIWLISFFGHTVTWRGKRFRLVKGKLIRLPQ